MRSGLFVLVVGFALVLIGCKEKEVPKEKDLQKLQEKAQQEADEGEKQFQKPKKK